MREANSIILRISGVVFLLMALLSIVEMLGLDIGVFAFIMNDDSVPWKIYFLFLGVIFTVHVISSLLSCCTALIFGGKSGYIQGEWNFSVLSLVSLALYVSANYIGMKVDGISQVPEEMQFTYLVWIATRAAFAIIVFVCCEKEKEFSWKNILPVDNHSRLCAKLTVGFTVAILAGAFIYAKFAI